VTRPGSAIRRFFGFVEKVGGGSVLRSSLLQALGDDAEANATLEALGRARIASEGPLAEALPCRQLEKCALEVREITSPAAPKKRLFVAICEADPRDCETTDVTLDEIRQSEISLREIAEAARTLLEIEPSAKLTGLTVDKPLAIGEHAAGGAETRDVFLYLRPRPEPLGFLLDKCGRATRGSLVLVPTFDTVDAELRRNHGPGAHVELETLGDLFAIRDGALALAPRLRSVRPQAEQIERMGDSPGPRPAARKPGLQPTTVTLVIDAPRSQQNMGLLANGARLEMIDSYFGLLIRLISAHLLTPDRWVEYREVGLAGRKRDLISRVCGVFEEVAPKGFRVLVTDRRGHVRLNPAVVIERVDWKNVCAHPHEPVKAAARLHLKT
jgi:hypothetical protein